MNRSLILDTIGFIDHVDERGFTFIARDSKGKAAESDFIPIEFLSGLEEGDFFELKVFTNEETGIEFKFTKMAPPELKEEEKAEL